ncbi:MAG: hypothetical protein KAT25_00625 [Sulfuriflexus sp.]|nr:hypothetical protein [Sulfuriflexus sp.]
MRIQQLSLTLLLILNSLLAVGETRLAPQHEIVAEGVTQLSPFFSIKLSGNGWFNPRILRVYHHDKDKKTLLGLARFSEHASRQNGYALSSDGKTILYFHQKLPDADGLTKSGGLYEFRHGGVEKKLHHFINNSQYLPMQLPPHILVFTKLKRRINSTRLDSEIYLRDTDGNEKRWYPTAK